MYGVMKVVIIVIAPTIGNIKELVAPISTRPLATTEQVLHQILFVENSFNI
jgi:hypothetical protein